MIFDSTNVLDRIQLGKITVSDGETVEVLRVKMMIIEFRRCILEEIIGKTGKTYTLKMSI
jgi:hypothetical protein